MKKATIVVVALAVLVGFAFVNGLYAQTMEKLGGALKEKAAGKTPDTAPQKGETQADEPKAGPCKQIIETCKKAGFVYGDAQNGDGLYRHCVNPIIQGKSSAPGAKKPMPSADQKVVAECKTKHPDFGKGKVGTK